MNETKLNILLSLLEEFQEEYYNEGGGEGVYLVEGIIALVKQEK